MLYVLNITIPPSTSKDKPIEAEIEINEPILKRVSCFFPPGVCCLAGFRILYGTDQIFPKPDGEYVTGHAETVSGDIYFRVPELPCKLRIQCFNEDTKYQHTLYIRLETAEAIEYLTLQRLEEIIQLLRYMIYKFTGEYIVFW